MPCIYASLTGVPYRLAYRAAGQDEATATQAGEAGDPMSDERAERDESPPSIRFEDVTTTYDEEVVLHQLRAELPAGQITVLMGASGAGKTTLVRQLVGLLRPDSGRIVIGDRSIWEIEDHELRELRDRMGVLLGGSMLFESSVFGSMSVFDNVAYPLRLRGDQEDAVRARAMWWLDTLSLADVAEAMPEELPAHARRRIAIGRALVADPPLVVIDDIDLGLDSTTAARTVRAIRETQARTGATMLVITHDIELARALDGRLAVLANGRIVANGRTAELLDGVDDAAEFDRRFRVLDGLGPPRLEFPPPKRREWTVTFDPQLLMFAAVALAVVLLAIFILQSVDGPLGP